MFRGKADMRLLAGTAHPQLAKDIADYVGVPLGDATVSSFPDGETFVKINENVRGAMFSSSSRRARRPTRI